MARKTYVEISPRQSGKTTRLINAAVNHLIDGNDVFLMSHTMSCTLGLEKKIKGKLAKYELRMHDPNYENEPYYTPSLRPRSLYFGRIYTIMDKSDFIDPQRNDKFRGMKPVKKPRFFCDEYMLCKELPVITGGYYVGSGVVTPGDVSAVKEVLNLAGGLILSHRAIPKLPEAVKEDPPEKQSKPMVFWPFEGSPIMIEKPQ